MRRAEIIEAVDQISKAFEECGVIRLLTLIRRPRTDRENQQGRDERNRQNDILEVMSKYSVASSAFSPTAKNIMRIFDLTPLDNPEMWVRFLNGPVSPSIVDFVGRIRFITEQLSGVSQLLSPEILTNPAIREGIQAERESSMSVILPEDNHFSSPTRIANTLLGIELLYQVCADIEGLDRNDDLAVVSCDSGSDKSFDILGAAKAVAALKELLLSMWDRAVYFREKKFEQRLKLVAESLPVLERIGELEEKNSIEREKAELMRRGVVDGVTKFLSSGATIPEMSKVSRLDPRELLEAEPQLLISGPQNTEEDGDSSPTTDDIRHTDQDLRELTNLRQRIEELENSTRSTREQVIEEDVTGNSLVEQKSQGSDEEFSSEE